MCERCESCQQPLSLRDGQFICPGCGAHFPAQPCCPTCQAPLEVLRACGATDYFCRNGHGLIARARLLFRLPAH
ncbi:hypothetical protein FJW01_07315 [Pantoea deleyi]|uniref:Primosomal protein N' (Replication factor Y)-superfamily II helicase n=1 Tax=Pantoea deleyi TaxID=470932 RepID=A0A506QCD5_9GAMM|nr:zinc ribbon domain-containing protein [Pantoea deleyi]TPV43316.1 hypothetical protein FJW01_07315 [Pantoea deleyi]